MSAKRTILSVFLLLTSLASLSQELLCPQKNAADTCISHTNYLSQTDFSDKNGEVVTLAIRSARAPFVFNENPLTNSYLCSTYGNPYIYIIYSSWTSVNKEYPNPKQIKMYFSNKDHFFSKEKGSENRFYCIEGLPYSTNSIKTVKDWLIAADIHHLFDLPSADEWIWFRENARFTVTVTTTADGKEEVTLDRILPDYFVEVLE